MSRSVSFNWSTAASRGMKTITRRVMVGLDWDENFVTESCTIGNIADYTVFNLGPTRGLTTATPEVLEWLRSRDITYVIS